MTLSHCLWETKSAHLFFIFCRAGFQGGGSCRDRSYTGGVEKPLTSVAHHYYCCKVKVIVSVLLGCGREGRRGGGARQGQDAGILRDRAGNKRPEMAGMGLGSVGCQGALGPHGLTSGRALEDPNVLSGASSTSWGSELTVRWRST